MPAAVSGHEEVGHVPVPAGSALGTFGAVQEETMPCHSSRVERRQRLGRATLVAALLVVTAVNVHAQALYGSLVGNVTDETGAIVPGATVTITQKETNQTREQITPENGTYSFPNLQPGTYDVVVTLPGFRTFATRDITVNVGAIVRVDARLALGTLEESVVVTGETAILQADSAALQSVTTAQALENLPINGRSYQPAHADAGRRAALLFPDRRHQ
jgi:hypothetical protein